MQNGGADRRRGDIGGWPRRSTRFRPCEGREGFHGFQGIPASAQDHFFRNTREAKVDVIPLEAPGRGGGDIFAAHPPITGGKDRGESFCPLHHIGQYRIGLTATEPEFRGIPQTEKTFVRSSRKPQGKRPSLVGQTGKAHLDRPVRKFQLRRESPGETQLALRFVQA